MPQQSGALPFRCRRQAGRALAAEMTEYRGRTDLLILALPRGGVVVGFELAEAFQAPLDVLLVRKLGVPSQKELAFGAIAVGGVRFIDQDVVDEFALTPAQIEEVAAREVEELRRGDRAYRAGMPAPAIGQRVVILADDGLATGSTMRAALAAVKHGHPARVIVAVPVASLEGSAAIRQEADELVCLARPEPFRSVGYWYRDFRQISDLEVRELLARSAHARPA